MKATKKIVGAAVALVAAVALSAGSTFAWFASNGTVEVSGMQVQAKIPSSLLIAANLATGTSNISSDAKTASYTAANPAVANVVDTTSTAYSSSGAEMGDTSATTLQPVHVTYASAADTGVQAGLTFATGSSDKTNNAKIDANTTAITWQTDSADDTTAWNYVMTPENANKASVKGAEAAGTALEPYAKLYNMSVYLPSGDSGSSSTTSDQNLNATVTLKSASSEGDNQLKFLHVGILAQNVGASATTTAWSTTYNSDYIYRETVVDSSTVTYNLNSVINTMSYNTYYNLLVVVYFEGADVDCYNDNALDTSALSVELQFKTESSSTTSGYVEYTIGGTTESNIYYKANSDGVSGKWYTLSESSYTEAADQITAIETGSDGYVYTVGTPDSGSTYYTLGDGNDSNKFVALTTKKITDDVTGYKIGSNWYTVTVTEGVATLTALKSATVGTTTLYYYSNDWYEESDSSLAKVSESSTNVKLTSAGTGTKSTKIYYTVADESTYTYYVYNSLTGSFDSIGTGITEWTDSYGVEYTVSGASFSVKATA